MIFDESTLRKITQLALVSHQVRAGLLKGEQHCVERGTSLEFADYRNYSPGDDLRRLDWNVYARSDKPFLKLFEEEEDLAVHVLLDGSRSMDWGEGDQNKFRYAVQLGAALGAIALSSGDRLTTALLSAARPIQAVPRFGPARGQPNTMAMLQFMEKLTPGGVTDLPHALRDYTLAGMRPGLAFLISDLFSPGQIVDGLARLQERGCEVTVIHLLSPDEIEPPLAGDLRLLDIETGQAQEVSIDGNLRRLYMQRLLDWREGISASVRKRGARYLGISTAQPWDQVILEELRRMGVVK